MKIVFGILAIAWLLYVVIRNEQARMSPEDRAADLKRQQAVFNDLQVVLICQSPRDGGSK